MAFGIVHCFLNVLDYFSHPLRPTKRTELYVLCGSILFFNRKGRNEKRPFVTVYGISYDTDSVRYV